MTRAARLVDATAISAKEIAVASTPLYTNLFANSKLPFPEIKDLYMEIPTPRVSITFR
jgi:hypothetical protein